MAKKKKKPEPLYLACKNCDGNTVHAVLREFQQNQDGPDVQIFNQYQIVRCGGCEEVSFRSNWQSTEDWYRDPETGEGCLDDHESLYPSRLAGRKELKNADLLPSKILSLYRETHHALCYRLRILAGIGIRGLIEAVCKEKGAAGKDLNKRIDALVAGGFMSTEGAEILHGARLTGNDAAHDAIEIPEQQLDEAMDVVEHLLIGALILPKKAKTLLSRRAKNPAEPPRS